MNPVTRGIRNAFRNGIRTFSIIIILGLSVGLSISMLVARQAVQDKIQTVKSSIGNTISITPAGVRGFEGGGNALTGAALAKVSSIENVTNVAQSLNDRLTSDTSNLQSSIDAGSLGNRAQNSSGVGFQGPPPEGTTGMPGGGSSSQVTRTFTPPVTVTGVSSTEDPSIYGADKVTFTSGSTIDAKSDKDEAVLGTALAAKNNLSVGSTFTAYSKTIKVVGIYDTGNTFSNNGVVMPIRSLQRLSEQPDAITSAVVTVNSVDTIDTAVASIKTELGATADVVSNQTSAKTATEPLESVKTISTYSVFGAVIAGSVIILLTMMMIVRERRREIGVMKAIGSSNTKTILQFVSEAITLTAMGLIAGLIIGVFAAQPITKVLVNNSTSSNNQQQPGQFPGRRPMASGNATLRNIKDVRTTVGPTVMGYGALVALLIAIIGSAAPAYLLSKVRPAEVMRAD